MPPFSPDTAIKVSNPNWNMNTARRLNESSNDSQDVPFKPLVLELPSASSFSTLPTAVTSPSEASSLSPASSSSTSFASSPSSSFKQPNHNNSQKLNRSVSFREEADVVHTIQTVNHPQDVYDRWYSKRELHIIRHKIRSLLKWVNMRNEHYFQYEQQPTVEYYDDDSQEAYLRTIPPPPQPPCVTFYDECLFGLEKHLFNEREQVRETKFHAQTAVFYEQQLQKEMGRLDEHRLAYSYAQTSMASQQEALAIAQINAQESEQYGQELQAQIQLEQEQWLRQQRLQQERELELRQMERLESSFLEHPQDAQHLFLLEPKPAKNPFDIFGSWKACFGKLFRPHECEIDSDEDCLNAPPRQPQRHPCLNVPPEEEEDLYYQ